MNKLTSRYRNISTSMKAALWFTAMNFIQQALSLLTTPIFTRIMSGDEYGLVNLYNSWESIIAVLVTFRISYGVYQVYLLDYDDDKENLTSSMATLALFMVSIGFLIFSIFKAYIIEWTGLPISMFYIMFIDIACQSIWSFWTTKKRFAYTYRTCVVMVLINAFLRVGISISMVLLVETDKAFYRVLGNSIPTAVFAAGIYISMLIAGKRCFKFNYWRQAILFNIVLLPHYLSTILLASSDRLMISKLVGNTQVAYYSVAYSCASLINILNQSINSVFTPYTFNALKIKKYDGLRKYSVYFLILSMCVSIILIMLAPEAIAVFAPASYYEAIYVIPPITCSVYLSFFYSLFVNVEFYYKKNIYITVATAVGAIINIILNYLFIPFYGYIAAAYTTLFGYMVMVFCHYCFYKKILRTSVYNIKIMLLITLGMFAISALCLLLYSHPIIRYGMIVLFIIGILAKHKFIFNLFKKMKSN